MIQSLRSIKSRLRSVDNTKKITRAMEMVSAAKLNRVENLLVSSREYFAGLGSLLKNIILSEEEGFKHPLLETRNEKKAIALCLITSDTGLCSSYNNALIHSAEAFIQAQGGKARVKLITVGRKGFNYFRRLGFEIPYFYLGTFGRYSDKISAEILKALTDIFLSKAADDVYVAYTHFESKARRRPVVEKFLNIEFGGSARQQYIFEPGKERILERLIPKFIENKMRLILLDAFASEHATRMIAMEMSTSNATELIGNLILLRNKARQASITKEVLEVISSAEALKG